MGLRVSGQFLALGMDHFLEDVFMVKGREDLQIDGRLNFLPGKAWWMVSLSTFIRLLVFPSCYCGGWFSLSYCISLGRMHTDRC